MNIIDEIKLSGHSISYVADKLGIIRQTLYNWGEQGENLDQLKKDRVYSIIKKESTVNEEVLQDESRLEELENRVQALEQFIIKHFK